MGFRISITTPPHINKIYAKVCYFDYATDIYMDVSDFIKYTIGEYVVDGLFKEWLSPKSARLLSYAISAMCDEECNEIAIAEYGKKLFNVGIPSRVLMMMIEKIESNLPDAQTDLLIKRKNSLAHGYILNKMKMDKRHLLLIIKESADIFNRASSHIVIAHVIWLHQWIDARLKKKSDPQMDPSECIVGKWIHKDMGKFITSVRRKNRLIREHKSLHAIAKNSALLYDKGEYYYALEFYPDLYSFTMRVRDQFNFFFLKEKLEALKTDYLTNLKNRFALVEDLVNNKNNCLAMVNINDFSKMNILYGRKYGDKVLLALAASLKKYVESGNIYRLYADQFAFIVDASQYSQVANIIKKIEDETSKKHSDILTSINCYGTYGLIDDTIFDRSEYAIFKYHKSYGKLINADKVKLQEMKTYAQNLNISQELQIALLNNRVVAYYQPIVSAQNSEIVKYEALMRIIDSKGNILLPQEFLPILENMYIYPECTRIMFKTTFELFENRSEEFSLNLSIADIENDDTRLYLFELFKKYPQTTKRCTVELLETEAVQDYKKVENFFQFLKQYDVKTALDDFGAGYSNFAYLFNLKIDYIKIDGSIIQSLNDPKMATLVHVIVEMAKKLGVQTIAEFVSDESLTQQCKSMGIDFLQGFAFGKAELLK